LSPEIFHVRLSIHLVRWVMFSAGCSWMRVLVTGGTGFIGRRLVANLVEEGCEVTALVRKTSNKDILPEGITIVEGDMLDESSLEKAVKGQDAVVHLAAYFDFYAKNVRLLYQVNVGGTRSLIKKAAGAGVKRFVYCSTTEVIGPVKNPPGNEETELQPEWDYSKSKVMGETAVREATKETGIEHVIIRPTGVLGDNDTYVFFEFMKSINDGALPVIPGGGRHYIMFTHVDDVAGGLITALTSRSAKNNTFILCPDNPMTWKEIILLASDYMGAKPPRVSVPVPVAGLAISLIGLLKNRGGKRTFMWRAQSIRSLSDDRWYSNEKAKKLLGWSPKMSMQESIKKALEAHIAEGRLVRNKKGSLVNLFLG
jgi:dihydroflavonol-4-reductase